MFMGEKLMLIDPFMPEPDKYRIIFDNAQKKSIKK